MKIRITHILLFLISLLAGLSAFAQSPYVIDVVCVGSERHYRLDGEAGSSYIWMLTDPAGIVDTLPETADTVTIQWNVPLGIYYLSAIQHDSITGCDGLLEIGYIEVIDGPAVFAGDPVNLCQPVPYALIDATASNYSELLWTSVGDGTFDDATQLHPVYSFGPNDIITGSVTLILTAQGLGNAGSCPPVASSVIITLDNLQVSATITPASCPAVADGAIQLTGLGGTEPYTYIIGLDTNNTGYFNHLATGDYIYFVTDSSGCAFTDTVRVDVLPAITATVDYTDETYLGADDGTITVHAQGGSGSYEYSIDDAMLVWQADSVFTGLTPGSYNVYVRDSLAHDCYIFVKRITIGTSPALVALFDHTDITCFGVYDGTITFINPQNGSGVYEFSIDDTASWHSDTLFTGLQPGTYTLWIRDSLNISNTQMLGVVVIQPAIPLDAQVTVIPETSAGANDGQVVVSNPTGGSGSYEFSIDGGLTWQPFLSGPQLVFSPLPPGPYTVIMRDSAYIYCQIDLESVIVPEADALYADIKATQITCYDANDGIITLTNLWGGSGSYEFSIDGGLSWQSDSTFSGLPPDVYTIIMRDSLQTTNTHTFNPITITEPAELFAEVTLTAATCAGNDGTITVHNSVGGSGLYLYSINGFIWQADTIFNNLTAGGYNVFIRDSLSQTCQVNLGLFIVPSDCPLSANMDTTAITCYGASDGSITITNPQGGTGIYEYSIDGGNTWTVNTTFTGLGPDTYVVLMRDANDNSLQIQLGIVILTDPAKLDATVLIGNETIPFASDGSLTITLPTGGSGSYEYSLDNITWQTSNVFAPLAPGPYTVYIRDANNIDCFNILGPYTIYPAGEINAGTEPSFVTCYGANDGIITVINPQGGSGVYEYSIDGGTTWQSSNVFTSLAAGFYTIKVRDLNNPGNITTLPPIEVEQPEELNALVNVTNISCNGGNSGIITFKDIEGGSGNYEFSINEGLTWQPDSLFNNLPVGEYIVMLRDSSATWCYRAIDTVNIIQGTDIIVDVKVDPSTCGDPNGVITVMADGGVEPFEYMLLGYTSWQADSVFTGLPAGSYTVVVHDAALCEVTYDKPVIVVPNPGPVITRVEVWNSVNGNNKGHIVIHTSGGTPPLEYSLDSINWQSSPRFENLSPGINLLAYVRDRNGCIDTAYFSVGDIVLGIIQVRPNRVIECVGSIRELPIMVENFVNVASFRLQLSYDPTILQYNGIADYHPSLLESAVTVTETSPGVLLISYIHPGGTLTIADGEDMLDLSFQGIAPGLTDLTWQFLQCVVYTSVGLVEPITAVVDGLAEILANPKFLAYRDSSFCTGDSTLLFTEYAGLDQLTYTWTNPRGITHNGPSWRLGSLTTLDAGSYIVTGSSDNCESTDTVNVEVFPAPDLHIAYTDTLCFGNPVILDPGDGFTQYEWSDGSNMNRIVAYEAGIYWVKVVDFNGCRAIDSVELVPCILEVLIPNAFTPNGDGLNDDFEPIFRGFEPKDYRMDIYSKWGQLIYTTKAIGKGWDGTVNGVLVSPDTFVYSVSYEVPAYVLRKGLSSPIKGSVTVVR